MKKSRIEKIKELIEKNGKVSYDELAALMPNYSEMTLRRDLCALESEGLIIRVRGGAVSLNELSKKTEEQFSARVGFNISEKKEIAAKAIELIDSTNSLFVDSGSTTLYFAKQLPNINYFVVTNGLNIATELLKKSMMMVTVIGGDVSRNNLATVGKASLDWLEKVNIDTAVMTTTAYNDSTGFTCGSQPEAEIKSAVIRKAKRVIMLLDGSKVNRTMPYTFAYSKEIDCIVVDSNFPKEKISAFRAEGVQVI